MIYSYWCEKCGEQEISFRLGEAPGITTCPKCGEDAKRMFTVPHIVWKFEDCTIKTCGECGLDQVRDLKRQKKIKD